MVSGFGVAVVVSGFGVAVVVVSGFGVAVVVVSGFGVAVVVSGFGVAVSVSDSLPSVVVSADDCVISELLSDEISDVCPFPLQEQRRKDTASNNAVNFFFIITSFSKTK